MACCGDYDEQQTLADQSHFAEACFIDFRQQFCVALFLGLEKSLEAGLIQGFKNQVAVSKLANWLEDHQQDCNDALQYDASAASDLYQGMWDLGSDGPWSSEVDSLSVTVTANLDGVYQPNQDYEACSSVEENDGEFLGEIPSPLMTTYDVLLQEASGSMVGPLYNGGAVTTSGDFASLLTSCSTPFCSHMSLSSNRTNEWAIDAMLMRADGDLLITNGVDTQLVTDARIELYSQALGSWTYTVGIGYEYEVPTGSAYFVVVGLANGEWVTLLAKNSTAITATESAREWFLDPFDIEYIDDSSAIWTLSVGPSSWL